MRLDIDKIKKHKIERLLIIHDLLTSRSTNISNILKSLCIEYDNMFKCVDKKHIIYYETENGIERYNMGYDKYCDKYYFSHYIPNKDNRKDKLDLILNKDEKINLGNKIMHLLNNSFIKFEYKIFKSIQLYINDLLSIKFKDDKDYNSSLNKKNILSIGEYKIITNCNHLNFEVLDIIKNDKIINYES